MWMGVPFIVSLYRVAVMGYPGWHKLLCDKLAEVRVKIRRTLWIRQRKMLFGVYYLLFIHMFLNIHFKFRLLL
jgi:hypothetical protein